MRKKKKKEIKSKVEFILFKIFLKIFGLLPYRAVREILGRILVFGGMVLKIRKSVAQRQLVKIFPDKSRSERKKILWEMYYNMGITAAEMYFAKPQELFENVQVSGWENLAEAVALEKGVILASFHSGNWELAGKYIAQHYKTSVIIKRQRNRYFDEYTNKLREKDNITIIYRKNALRQVLKLLKKNFIIAIMIDQSAGKKGVKTNFLGYPASTYVGAAKIALKTGSPIVPSIALRKEDGSHHFIFKKTILPRQFKKENEPAIALIEHISKQLEEYIYRYPEQWFWVHKRWKHDKKAKSTLQKSF